MKFNYTVPKPINEVNLTDGFHVKIRHGFTSTVRKLTDFVEMLQEQTTGACFGEITRDSQDPEAEEFKAILIDIIKAKGTGGIKVGDRVRSFDFEQHNKETEGKEACYVEGIVEDFGKLIEPFQTCNVYKIKCDKKVFAGKTIEGYDEYCFPPVNGTGRMMGDDCNGVVKVS